LTDLEQSIRDEAGDNWLNSWRAKDLVFGTLACGAAMMPPAAIIFASIINDWRSQPAFNELPEEKRVQILNEAAPRKYPSYFVAQDALMSIGQSPERVCLLRQRLEPDGSLSGEPDITFIAQADFSGRGKLFGVELDPEIVATALRIVQNSC
jgi:hypothetical protein